MQVYEMDFEKGKMVPISTEGKDDLKVGTVLEMNGYSNPRYVITSNLGTGERFRGYGAVYETVNLETLALGRHEAFTLKWLSEKKDGRIQIYITDETMPAFDVKCHLMRARALQAEKDKAQEKARGEASRLEQLGRELFKRHIPENAVALIVAECHRDESDIMTDYHGHSRVGLVVLGYSMHKRDLFPEMRRAAARIPETAHLGPGKGHFEPVVILGADIERGNGGNYWKGSRSHWHNEMMNDENGNQFVFETREEAQAHIDKAGEPGAISFDGVTVPFLWDITERRIEHREKWSMGSGYYLKDGHSNSSGWCVRKVVKYSDWQSDHYISIAKRCVFSEPSGNGEGGEERPENVTIRRNEERGGIEVLFPSKPEQGIIDGLKSLGFRWSKYQGLWWKRYDEQTMKAATDLINGNVAEEAPAEKTSLSSPELRRQIRLNKAAETNYRNCKRNGFAMYY